MITNSYCQYNILYFFIIITPLLLSKTCCSWPLLYDINLDENETFELNEDFDNDDKNNDDIIFNPEDEMIQHRNTNEDNDKYFRIHQMAMRSNRKQQEQDSTRFNKTRTARFLNNHLQDETDEYTRFNDNHKEDYIINAVPWIGGFVDRNNNFIMQPVKSYPLIY